MCQNCNSIHRVVDCKMSVSVLLKIVKWLSRMKIFLISKRSLKQCICCPEFGKVHFVPNGLYRPCTWGNAFWLHGVTRSNTFRLHLSPKSIHFDCICHQRQYILIAQCHQRQYILIARCHQRQYILITWCHQRQYIFECMVSPEAIHFDCICHQRHYI